MSEQWSLYKLLKHTACSRNFRQQCQVHFIPRVADKNLPKHESSSVRKNGHKKPKFQIKVSVFISRCSFSHRIEIRFPVSTSRGLTSFRLIRKSFSNILVTDSSSIACTWKRIVLLFDYFTTGKCLLREGIFLNLQFNFWSINISTSYYSTIFIKKATCLTEPVV